MKNITDHAGIIIACTCVVHCVLLPILLVASATTINDNFHVWALVLTIAVTGHALWHGYKRHCRHIVLFLGTLGILSLIGGVVFHFIGYVDHGDHHHGHGFMYGEQIVTIIGSILLVAAHIMNMTLKKAVCCTNDTD